LIRFDIIECINSRLGYFLSARDSLSNVVCHPRLHDWQALIAALHNYSNCLECKEIPCDIWKKTRDPKFTDAEFEKNIMDRIELLKTVNSKA